jgi:hypothetical protein
MTSTKELTATAYHESGHAVLHLVHGRAFRTVTVIANGDHLGGVVGTGRIIAPESFVSWYPARQRRWAEAKAQILLAGGAAEALHRREGVNLGSLNDIEKLSVLAHLVNGGRTNEAMAWLDWQMVVTLNHVEHNWPFVEKGAARLLDAGTLSCKEFKEACGWKAT